MDDVCTHTGNMYEQDTHVYALDSFFKQLLIFMVRDYWAFSYFSGPPYKSIVHGIMIL